MDRSEYIFRLNRFLLRPEHTSKAWRFQIWDKKGDPVLYFARPRYSFVSLMRAAASIAIAAAAYLGISTYLPEGFPGPLGRALPFVAFLAVLIAVSLALTMRYMGTFFLDDSEREVYLQVIQENRFPFPHTWFTLKDKGGRTIGRIRRNFFYLILTKVWHLYGEDGSTLCIAREDSALKSIVSRFIGAPTTRLRTNFTIYDGKFGSTLGKLDRRNLVFGCYVLDMDSDYKRTIDRRLALAFGVMLDAGEKA